MLKDKTLTYISLFSSAGVGCYGFKKANFKCVATNELITRRLNVQKINNKCEFDSGYINGDITLSETKELIFEEINKWNKLGNDKIDVLIATPPCQGMSVANQKKNNDDIIRNSLVVESIKMISKIEPRFFIFENVSAFMKTGCTSPSGEIKEIETVIKEELGNHYDITSRILNFKNYGSNSSRTRTIVIGVHKSLSNFISPIELYPNYQKEKTLKEVIGNLSPLNWNEFDENDFYHQFRIYPEHMRDWIHNLKEGQGAFDNKDPLKRPHKLLNGVIIPHKEKNSDKYTRQYWGKVAPCIHTRNDQLASQNTIHPSEDRVFSIRELMKLMSIPDDFKWIDMTLEELNKLSDIEKRKLLKKEEINIRQSIGEAVPTEIFYRIANNISDFLNKTHLKDTEILKIKTNNLLEFIDKNPMNLGISTLSKLAELFNNKRETNSAYFTDKFLIHKIIDKLPDTDKNEIHILEPSVGVGNFLPLLIKKYEDKKIILDICDIDETSLEITKLLLNKFKFNNVKINYICDDFLNHQFKKRYFLVIGNPPFTKLKKNEVKEYLCNNINQNTTNLFEFFLEKAMKISDYVVMITPKNILNTSEFTETRKYLEMFKIDYIIDFGEQGFKNVLIETICLFINTKSKPKNTTVISTTLNKEIIQKQNYICDNKLPYWIIYRDDIFDKLFNSMEFNLFDVFRDRQITNSNTSLKKEKDFIRVLKSRNITDLGEIIDIENYNSYIDKNILKDLSVYQYMNNETIYLTPNMTYKPRVIKNIKDVVVNGSIAILIPKENIILSKEDMDYYSSDEYRNFYKIARNYQTRSLNIDNTSVYWFGKRK